MVNTGFISYAAESCFCLPVHEGCKQVNLNTTQPIRFERFRPEPRLEF